jgi:hypothetical protein
VNRQRSIPGPSTRAGQLEQAPGQPGIDAAAVAVARGADLTAADLTAVAAAHGAVARRAGHVQGLGSPDSAQRSGHVCACRVGGLADPGTQPGVRGRRG